LLFCFLLENVDFELFFSHAEIENNAEENFSVPRIIYENPRPSHAFDLSDKPTIYDVFFYVFSSV